jgi:hypothetical protein
MIRRWCPRVSSIAACAIGFVSLIGLSTSSLLARQGTLSTNDGRVMQGDIEESSDGQSVNITIHGATVTLDRASVSSISYSDDPTADFQKRLKALDPTDITGRLQLSRMELDAKQYDLAADAAKDVQHLDPHNPDAAILLDTIQSQRNLATSTQVAAAAATQPGAEVTAPANPAPSKYLTPDDVQAIRRFELEPDDNVRVSFYNNVRQRFLAAHTDVTGFDSLTSGQQALSIIQTDDQSLIKDVRIETDPLVMRQFHDRVLPRVLDSCISCHGTSNGAGGFVLFPDSKEPVVWYTDFYILQKVGFKIHTTDMFGNAGLSYRHMIDRIRPEDSLLLSYGLPKSVSKLPHPDAKGFKPIFHNTSDPIYLDVSKWITSLKAIAPDYGIKYDVPTGSAPTTQGQ